MELGIVSAAVYISLTSLSDTDICSIVVEAWIPSVCVFFPVGCYQLPCDGWGHSCDLSLSSFYLYGHINGLCFYEKCDSSPY